MTHKKKPVVYIAGPMTGIEDFNYPLFNKVATIYRMFGNRVINPAEFYGGKQDRSRSEYMRKSFQSILNSTHIVLLPGWKDSQGALLEVFIAQELGLYIQEYEEPSSDDDVSQSTLDEQQQ